MKGATTTKITAEQVRGMKPAVYRGVMFNKRTKKISYVCWPGVRFPKHRGVVILKRRQFKSAALAKAWAALEIDRRQQAWLAKYGAH